MVNPQHVANFVCKGDVRAVLGYDCRRVHTEMGRTTSGWLDRGSDEIDDDLVTPDPESVGKQRHLLRCYPRRHARIDVKIVEDRHFGLSDVKSSQGDEVHP